MSEEKSLQYFQWIKGDTAGKVVEWEGAMTVNPEGKPALIFKDGTTGEETLLNDYFVEVASPNEWDLVLLPEPKPGANNTQNRNVSNGASIAYEGQEGADVIIARPPDGYVPPRRGANANNTQPAKEELSPIFKLLSDSRKTPTCVEVSVEVDVPGVELMKVLAESYENGEAEVLKYLASTLDMEEIKMQIARQIWRHTVNNKKSRKRANETA